MTSEGTTPYGIAYRVEWDDHHQPVRLLLNGAEHEVTSMRRYRGSGVFLKCAAGTLVIAQIPGRTDSWLPSDDPVD